MVSGVLVCDVVVFLCVGSMLLYDDKTSLLVYLEFELLMRINTRTQKYLLHAAFKLRMRP